MALPLLGSVLGFASSALGLFKKKPVQQVIQAAAPFVGGAIAGSIAAPGPLFGRGGRRRRAKKAMTMNELGMLMVLGQSLGKNSPVVTLAAMKAMSGKLA